MNDCVASDPDDYVRLALRLGTEPDSRAEVQAKIMSRKHAPL